MVDVPGAQLFTREIGDGEPRVILHGGPGASHDYLRPQMDALADPGRLVYYDQRGSGQSTLAPGTPPGGWREHVDDLERVRVALGIAQLKLVGYSWGGLLALLYALEHPERVARLALVSPAPASAAERPAVARRFLDMARRPSVQALRDTLDMSDRRARFAVAVAAYFVDPRRALELTPFVVQSRAEAAVWNSLGDYDLYPRLPSLRVPALVAHGRQDPIPVEGGRRIAESLGGEFLPLDGAGHVPFIEAPGPLFFALRRFLDG